MQMTMKLIAPTVWFLAANILIMAQAPGGGERKATPQICQLISANPPGFNPFQFLPKKVDFTRLNRSPKVSWIVNEDGSVSNVKILKGTGDSKVNVGLVKSIQAWKYKPQPGCTFEGSIGVFIDIGFR
jgi:TonB family protein